MRWRRTTKMRWSPAPDAQAAPDHALDERHDLDAVAAVIHTSGTTSAPRPIELSYGNFLWSALGSAVAPRGGPTGAGVLFGGPGCCISAPESWLRAARC